MKWVKRTIMGLTGLMLVLMLVGASYQTAMTWRGEKHFPPPGELIHFDGRALHVQCEGRGTPVVLLEAGLGADATLTWRKIVPTLARHSKVCFYDRAGYGWSDSGPKPRDTKALVYDLGHVVDYVAPDGKVLLVGHSLGGLDIRDYAVRHLDRIAGMVLLDSVHEEQDSRLPPEPAGGFNYFQFVMRYGAPFGLPRLYARAWTPRADFLTDADYARLLELESRTSYQWAVIDELEAVLEHPHTRMPDGALGDMPLFVLSRDTDAVDVSPFVLKENKVWAQLQQELVPLSTRGHFHKVTGSGHNIQIDKPQAAISAILETLADTRAKPATLESM